MTSLYTTPNQFFEEFDMAATLYHHATLSPYWKVHTAHRLLKISHDIIAQKHHELLQRVFEQGIAQHDFRKEQSYPEKKALLLILIDAIKITASMYETHGAYLMTQCEKWSTRESVDENEKETTKRTFRDDVPLQDFLMNIQHIIQICRKYPFKSYLASIKKYRVKNALFMEP